MAQLVEDDLPLGALPQRHKPTSKGNHAYQSTSVGKDSSVRSVATTSPRVCPAQEATSGMHGSHMVPKTSIATTHHASRKAGSQEQDAQKAKVVDNATVAERCNANGLAARQRSECQPLGGNLQADAIVRASDPAAAKRLLEHTGNSNDRGRALPKAAAIIRGFKGREEEGLQRTTSNLSLTGVSSKANALSQIADLHDQAKAKGDSGGVHAPPGDIPKQQGR